MMSVPLWRASKWRRKVFEFLGSDRFSRTACCDIERKLEKHFNQPGFFIEAGAVDGVFESNTYYLERFRQWRGILIEPSPAMFSRLSENRKDARVFNCALVEFDYKLPTVTLMEAHAFSGLFNGLDAREQEKRLSAGARSLKPHPVEVPARTLQSVVDEVGIDGVDLLSLDVEGYEAQALRGLDLEQTRPRYILVECLDDERKREIDAVLQSYYEFVEKFSYRDFFYRAKER